MSYEGMAGLIEMSLFYSLAIGFGIWQVVKTRREIAADREAKRSKEKTVDETKKVST